MEVEDMNEIDLDYLSELAERMLKDGYIILIQEQLAKERLGSIEDSTIYLSVFGVVRGVDYDKI